MKKNRIRTESGTEKLDARNLLSGSTISHWCSYAPQAQAFATATDGSSTDPSVSGAVGDAALTTSSADGAVASDGSSTDAAATGAVGDTASTTGSADGAVASDGSSTDASASDSPGDVTSTSNQGGAEYLASTTGGVAGSEVGSSAGPIVINNFNGIGRGFWGFNQFEQGNNHGSGRGQGTGNGTSSQGTSQHFDLGNGITINNVNRIGGFGRRHSSVGHNFGGGATDNVAVTSASGTSVGDSSSGATGNSGGITINNINRIGLGRGGFGRGNFGGHFSGNFSGIFHGQFNGHRHFTHRT